MLFVVVLAVLSASVSANVANQTYYADTGVFNSPNYPNNYDNNLHYFVTVTVDPGYYIAITLLDFVTEACCDKLYIWDGTDVSQKTIAKSCNSSYSIDPDGCSVSGTQTGSYYFSRTNQVTFMFYSDPVQSYRGFAIKWEQTKDNTKLEISNSCPPTIQGQAFGAITSPNWPANYPNNVSCAYKLASTKSRVKLQFVAFQTEACCDKVTIYDGPSTSSPVLATLAGRSIVNTTFYSSGPDLYLNFFADFTNNDVGFSAYYVSVT